MENSKLWKKVGGVLSAEFLKRIISSLKNLQRCSLVDNGGLNIHPTAIIHEHAILDENVEIGPFCYVGENVYLGAGCSLRSHVVINSNTVIGNGSTVHSFSSVGGDPQDMKYNRSHHPNSWLVLGADNVVREHSTINRGTLDGGGFTETGRSCLIMSGTHVGHDCILGNNVIISTGAGLAGHVEIGDDAIVGGQAGVKQRVHIGQGAMVGGKSAVLADVLPYTLVSGIPAACHGLNLVGLRRRAAPRDEVRRLADWAALVYRPHTLPLQDRLRAAVAAQGPDAAANDSRQGALLAFLRRPGLRLCPAAPGAFAAGRAAEAAAGGGGGGVADGEGMV